MSGCNFDEVCPKCGGTMYGYSDWKPHNMVFGRCINCGFCYWTEKGRMSLKEVNELRAEMDLRPLRKLAAWRRRE